jgi:metal-responsive CopG/Arc/MetJ family transcriptional regulator
MRVTVTTSLPLDEIRELDRVGRDQGLTRAEAVRDAIRRYLSSPYLPAFLEDTAADEIEP